MKAQANLNLGSITVPEMIENGRHYTTSIAVNAATFATPSPALAGINTAITALETAYTNALGGGKQLTAIMHDKKEIAANLLLQLSHYVEGIANGNETTILLSGMDLKRKGGRNPTVFSAETSIIPLAVELRAPYYSNTSYIWQMFQDDTPGTSIATDPNRNWSQAGVSNKGSITVHDLNIGCMYWFRYATVGKDGQSGWSDPISKIIEA